MTLADVKPAARPSRTPVRPRADDYALDPSIRDARTRLPPGSTGWTADELFRGPLSIDFEVARLELNNGVLTPVPAKTLAGPSLFRLMTMIDHAAVAAGQEGVVYQEADLRINAAHAPRADGVFLTAENNALQVREAERQGYRDPDDAPLLLPPTLVVEAISRGHERDDRVVNRALYAAWGVPHYWLLDAYTRRLDCLKLDPLKGEYLDDAAGEGDAELRPSLPFALAIPLGRLWPRRG